MPLPLKQLMLTIVRDRIPASPDHWSSLVIPVRVIESNNGTAVSHGRGESCNEYKGDSLLKLQDIDRAPHLGMFSTSSH